jgi:alkanesulfonate monooxygenase SsuD/methylene tetrahydromethanopterin reductase-like flavin-dependent oxidoreductase (luciferase family)
MTEHSRFKLGFFSYLQGGKPPAEIFTDAMNIFIAADELGFDMAWVAQHHFGHHGGLPSPFVFFSALAARTENIGVGTAVVSLPFENPIKVAEDAAVFETLFPGRLQLGLGTGFGGPELLTVFERPGDDRRALYDGSIQKVLDALAGEPIAGADEPMHPNAGSLRDRIWEAPSTLERVAESGARGSGLLLSRIAIGGGTRPSWERQVPMVELYKQYLPRGVAPRIGLSRTIYPTRRPETAYRNLTEGLKEIAEIRAKQGIEPLDMSVDDQLVLNNVHWGDPEAVVESLQNEPLFNQTTDLICQVQPGVPSFDETMEAIELIATEVAPALGWKPAKQRLRALA